MSQTELKPNQAMALSQLYVNNVNDEALLQALAGVPRHEFVPPHMQGCAYLDEDIAIGEGRYMLAPVELARLIDTASIKENENVLVIGAGLGYSVAIIAKLAKEVVGIDSSAMFKQHATTKLEELGITNASAEMVEDITAGLKQKAPYNVIVINGGIPYLPDTLVSQLADGGRLVFVHTSENAQLGTQGMGSLTIATRSGGRLQAKKINECFVPRLNEFTKPTGFSF